MIYVFVFAYQWWKPLPEFIDKPSPTHAVPASGVHFYADYTYLDKDGKRMTEQHIWDQIFSTIDNAHHAILLDMFLYNDFQGKTQETTRPLSRELTEKLVAKKIEDKHIAIALITDPINTVYGGINSPNLEKLRRSGIFVQMTDLRILPDSNLWWSAFWRPFISWNDNNPKGGWLRHPFQYGSSDVTLRSWFALLNFKANHRKLIVADEPIKKGNTIVGQKMTTIITSSNPHDASGAHGNVALKVDDQIWQDVFANEYLLAKLSGGGLPNWNIGEINDATGTLRVTLLREKWIRESALNILERAQHEDRIDIAMFYLSDRSIIKALKNAVNRGVRIRLILDPNKDAFGFEKNGIPNRPVAKELVGIAGTDIEIRWCDTHGEQCHAKLMMGKFATSSMLLVGSANFTRRNIGGYNLEASILVEGDKDFTAWKDAEVYFERLWNNTNGQFTVGYNQYEDVSLWKAPLYRMMERTGLSSF
jgi:phosphatidylserine/phosphatidylglycerophosphate/cardiolipin synthase-like enzyme